MNRLISNLIDNHENLIESIQQGSCVILIGSDFYTEVKKEKSKNDQEESNGMQGKPENEYIRLEEKLYGYLKEREDKLGIRAYENGWFHFRPESTQQSDAYFEIKRFYKQPIPEAEKLLEKLILIPNKLYLSLTPDTKILETFDAAKVPAQFSYYWKEQGGDKSPPLFKPIEGESPIVYNQLGYVGTPSSLIFTYDDFYDYLKTIFKNKSMDKELKEYIFEAQHFIFLGIPFDMWYVPLFMRILSEYHRMKKKTKYAVNLLLDDKVITHSHEQYTMTFVKNVGIKEFIDSLFDYFREKKLLRSFDFELLRSYLDKKEFNEFFEHILRKNKTLMDSVREFKDEPGELQKYLKQSKRRQSLDKIYSDSEANSEKFIALQRKYLEIIEKGKAGNLLPADQELDELTNDLQMALKELQGMFPNCTAD